MTAFTQSGIPAVVAEKMINRMTANLTKWKALIHQSFLPEKMKADYCELIEKRKDALNIR